jgi:purine-binding chemotaxis protein CheW
MRQASTASASSGAPHGAGLELISFEIGGQEFCLDISVVREIRGWTPATPMPQTPSYILGVINLRGEVMPILDLRDRLGLGRTEPTSRHVIVVVQDESRMAGLLVDAVQETFMVDVNLLQAPPAMDSTSNDLFVDAIIPLEGRMLSRLVVGALLPAEQNQAA